MTAQELRPVVRLRQPVHPAGLPAIGSLLTGTTILCQYHGSQFDITTGAIINGPAAKDLSVYEVNDANGTINIRI